MDTLEQIESSQYLFLVRIEEPEDNVLRILIEEAHASREGEDLAVSGAAFSDVHPIVSDDTCRVWEVAFKSHIAYSVRNESHTVLDHEEERTGRLFCVSTKSKFIDYLKAATIASM